MTTIGRRSILLSATLVLLVMHASSARAQNKCVAGKMQCASKKSACLLNVEAKGFNTGTAPDPSALQKCRDKFTGGADPTKGCFAKLELKNDGPCLSVNDTGPFEMQIDAFVDEMVRSVNIFPGGPKPCTAGKLKCIAKKTKCILGVNAKAAKTGLSVNATKLQKCHDKFDGGADPSKGCFAKLEAQYSCDTIGDTPNLEQAVDVVATELVNEAFGCPGLITFMPTSTGGVLDMGWTGLDHDETVVSNAMVTVAVTGCASIGPNCGVCNYAGPTINPPGALANRRCTNDTAVHCSSDATCAGGGGTCQFFFGSYLPLVGGGVAVCVENIFAAPVSGTIDTVTGAREGTAPILSRVFNAPTLDQPCPQCIGDALANDGSKGGTCSGGDHNTQLCDASGSSPNVVFGATSLDCPPSALGVIANLSVDLSNTTGTRSRTLSAASPNCRAFGFTSRKCQCDTCDNLLATPCSSNADCLAVGAAICGGKRCRTGANQGTPCAAPSECPGSPCEVPGAPTQPNSCAMPDTCVAYPFPGPNDRVCASGPVDFYCGPAETFRSCVADSDCAYPGDTCSGFRIRACFDNGNIGDVVNSSGQPDPPVNHMSHPTLAALFCVGPTAAPAVNSAAGLPGLGRLELQGFATDGTP